MKPTEQIVEPLLAWYDNHARILPWRDDPTPYRVWISEIMLQQTRVEAVKPFFERFLVALPTIESLAQVEEDKLLKLWEGLGYYNRARNLQKAANQIMKDFAGNLPKEKENLLKLSGIGSYTAGAIASIAYGQKEPAVDGNVLRVIARVTANYSDILSPKVKKELEEQMLLIMPANRARDFNQALMELGATVCIPNGAPKCGECPWESFCQGNIQKLTGELPKKTKKKPRVIEEKTIVVIQDENKVALHKRPNKGLLASMYEFPTLEGHQTPKQVLAYLEKLGFLSIRILPLENSRHIFTHKEWHMIGYAIRVDELAIMERDKRKDGIILVDKKETEEKYPIPAAFVAYTRYLNIRLGQSKFVER